MVKNKNNKKFVTKDIKQRILITVGLIVCGFAIIVISLANVSLIKHDEYSLMASGQQLRDTVVTAPRGTIYDTNMNELAKSATVWTVVLSPNSIDETNYDTIATGLSEILEMDYQTIFDKCQEKNYYSIIKRKVDQPVVDAIRQFMIDKKVGGINFIEDSKRYYPYGNFLAQVIGFVGTDNYGLSGIEAFYDEELSGTSGRIMTAKNAAGSDMYYEYETRYEPKAGNSLVLTIDEVIQHYLEKNLEAAVKEHNVQNQAAGIIMNVKTGEILAMAVKPDFDPNSPLTIFDETLLAKVNSFAGTDQYETQLGLAQQFQWRNKAVADVYEPGSVFKVVTASTALEVGAVTLDSTFYCSGSVAVGPHTMNCSYSPGHGQESFIDAVINSCNPAFIDIGQRIGIRDFNKYFKAFGLTEKTGVDLPGEAASIVYNENNMGIVELASCSFGQSNAITPIQLITAVSAAVNGGYLIQPHIVKEIIDAEGNIIQSFDTQIKRQVISADTSKLMAQIMEQVVINANGQNSYVAGFRIGGKSGTSQKLNGNKGEYVASFCGIAPADDPEIACLILLDNAKSYSIYGGILAAPVVGSIMSEVLPYIGVDPVYTEEELKNIDVYTPNVVGKSLTLAYSNLQPEGLTYEVIGDGTTVVSQFPTGGQSISRGSKVMLYTDEREAKTVEVPNLVGETISNATTTLKSYGLNVKVSGSSSGGASVTAQGVDAGAVVPVGSIVIVEAVNSSLSD